MKKVFLTMSVIALAFGSCKKAEDKAVTTTTTEKDTVKTETAEAEKPMDSAAKMKAWMDFATPGEVHKVLASDTGKWNCDMTFWEGPDAKPEKSTTQADVKMVFDGKYQESVYKGTMMGMPFEGKSTVGFNNASGKAFSTFYDNMGTGFMYVEGTYDAASKTFSFAGETTDPLTKKNVKYREEYVIVDDNTRKMSMFDTKNGSEYKSMEIVMTRAK
ncbi:DUF1579 domain-containing protein [Flavobacterium silvaticum]|uniref:DUF1579 domain-containing protein n=1 Tax=Flavobacterium silvaticum TaxID=1852020 RepID=A0A972FJ99_9FLAO|nr:DUF1579 domain-containing protein [Flavobacterium silvaticum]NMH27069.1 DUF1579 domain-containing protein [Flavobacterium silvaticum]